MQSHGAKRTSEEFKEIRKEWKARKKEEENARKGEDEQAGQAAEASAVDGQPDGAHPQALGYQQNDCQPLLPSIGYQAADGHGQGQYGGPRGGLVYPQGNGQMQNYANYPNSPYGQQCPMYQHRQY